jgi:propionyl-CoA synthetase
MLACARIGAVHSVVFGGFAPAELAARIDDARPTVVVSASCGIEPSRVVEYKPMLDAAIERAQHKPAACVVLQRPQAVAAMGERDVDWATVMRDGAVTPAECVPVAATDPLYVLYTSGTTGKPKGTMLTHRNLVANTLQTRHWMKEAQEGQERFLCVLPFFHIYGLTTSLNLPIALGATMYLKARFEVLEALQSIKRHQPTVFAGVPATPKCSRACASCTIIASRIPRIRSGCPWRRFITSTPSITSCTFSGSVIRTMS